MERCLLFDGEHPASTTTVPHSRAAPSTRCGSEQRG